MKKKNKRLIAILLMAMAVLIFSTASVSLADDHEEVVTKDAQLPESFDLRDVDGKSYVTDVKYQLPYGNCWAFAAISAAETSILGDPENLTSLTVDEINLSEKQLSYFAATPIDDPENPQNGEGVYGGADLYDLGGEIWTATSLFSAGIGPVLESEGEAFVYKGKNETVTKAVIDGIEQDLHYSKEDDWTIPESLRLCHSFMLHETFILPSPATIVPDIFSEHGSYCGYIPSGGRF